MNMPAAPKGAAGFHEIVRIPERPVCDVIQMTSSLLKMSYQNPLKMLELKIVV